MASVSRATLLARALRARAPSARQSFNRLSRRSYASDHGHGSSGGTLQGDIPWALGSVAATAGGLYLLWPEAKPHGSGHGHDDHAEHKEESKEEDAPKEQEESEDESKDESKDDHNSEEKSDDNEGEDKGEDDDGQPRKLSDKELEEKYGTKENPKRTERDDHNVKVTYKDAKGGVKVRLESQNAIKQGNKEGSEGGSANVDSGSGEHVFNTDTKHSTDVQNNSGMSTKGEGDAETAKLKRPVDPFRTQK